MYVPFFRVMQRCLCSRYFRWKGFLSWFLVDPFVTSGVLKLYYLLLPLAHSQNLLCILCFQLQSVLYFHLPQSDQLTVTPDSAAPRVYPDMVFVICHEKSVYIWYMYVPFFRVMQRCLCSELVVFSIKVVWSVSWPPSGGVVEIVLLTVNLIPFADTTLYTTTPVRPIRLP